jgi:DNA-binding transcriptional ArsR family regulator
MKGAGRDGPAGNFGRLHRPLTIKQSFDRWHNSKCSPCRKQTTARAAGASRPTGRLGDGLVVFAKAAGQSRVSVVWDRELEEATLAHADPLEPDRCAKLMASLSTPERLRVVRFLAQAPHNVTEIAEMLGVPKANASHHLKVLETAGLIEGAKKGRFVWFSLRPGILEQISQADQVVSSLNLGCCQFVLPPDKLVRRAKR